MSQPTGGAATCAHCGAPDGGELVLCRYCGHAVSAEAQAHAIPCPNTQCRTLSRWGKQNCKRCNAWLVVSCVFCGSLSPHHVSNCLSCHEAFAGAPQRKAQMHAHHQHRQNMQDAQVWGNLAIGALGVAAVVSSSSWGSDDDGISGFSSMSDDASFDFGGDD